MLIRGGYRSIPNFISAAKDEHTRGFEWHAPLAREQRRAGLAGKRGRGPSHQSAELPVDAAFGTPVVLQEVDGLPLRFMDFIVFASFFVLREVECTLTLAVNVTVDRASQHVSVLLPVSMTDVEALTCTRRWGCVCVGRYQAPCAYHAALRQQDFLVERFCPEGSFGILTVLAIFP